MPSKIYSFGYKHRWTAGLPSFPEHEVKVIDVRDYILDNPYNVRGLRNKTGLDPEVRLYFGERSINKPLIKIMDRIGDFKGHVYLGCTGGKHRSVYAADALGIVFNCPVEHLDINKP